MFSTTQPIPGTMKAMVYDKSGANRMTWHSDMKVPSPGTNEVLIRVASSSMNPLDFRLADHKGLFMSTPKRVVGNDMAGTIVGLGRDVRGFAVGDQVFGWGSGYANYTTAKMHEIARIPENQNVEDMGIYGLVGTCAHQVLRRHWLDKPDFNVRNLLIIGASGGVGSSLVQLARAYGGPEVRINAITSLKNTDYVRHIGANEVVDYAVRDFDIARAFPIHSMDLIIDTVSGTPEGSDYYHTGGKLLLKPQGQYVALNSTSNLDILRKGLSKLCGLNFQRARFDLFITQQKFSNVDLQAIARLIQQKRYRLNVAHEIPLLETPIRRALNDLRRRHIRGKVKIKPAEYGTQEQQEFESPVGGTPLPRQVEQS